MLARLAHLNACYEHKYPGLVYITFVNGRSRAEIKDEMEEKLGFVGKTVGTTSDGERVKMGDVEWLLEVRRAVADVGRIARSRLTAIGVEEGDQD